jgi:CelD/BcsL family acetyltransferase involved in cellulose biosynthesis
LPCRAQADVLKALLAHFENIDIKWDLIKWSGIRTDADGQLPVEDSRRTVLDRSLPAYLVDLPATWQEFYARIAGKVRKGIRGSYEIVEEDGLKLEFRIIDAINELDEALERFYKLHTARALCPSRQLPKQEACDFQSDMFRAFAEQGSARVIEMHVNGKLAAVRLAFVFGDELYTYYSGYDPEWKKYSVMTLLMVEAFKWAIENKFKILNLSTGKDRSKPSWKPTQIMLNDVTQPSSFVCGQIVFRTELWLRRRSAKEVQADETANTA